MQNVIINHADYSNMPSFARVCEETFASVAVLPNREIMSACLRLGANRSRGPQPVEIVVLADNDLYTAYRVGGERGDVIVIDAADGSVRMCSLNCVDDDEEAVRDELLAAIGC